MIKIEKLSYHLRNKRKLFENIQFILKDGEILLIQGETGCGKSTLLDILTGIKRIQSGSIYYDGDLFSAMIQKNQAKFRMNKIAYLKQSISFFDHLSIFDNILFQKKFTKRLSNKDLDLEKEKIMNYFKNLNLNISLDDSPKFLSGGEKVRVALIRSFMNDVKYLFIDESLSQLDKKLLAHTMTFIKRKLRSSLKNIIIVSHQKIECDQYLKLSRASNI